MSRRIVIRRSADPQACDCTFCGNEAQLEVEHSYPEEMVSEVCIDCARALGHASLGNRTWTPPEES